MLKNCRAFLLVVMAALSPIAAGQAAAQQAATGISRAEFDGLHGDFFFGADADFNLSLTPSEIDAQMRRSPAFVQGIVFADSYDEDGDGLVSYDEFMAGADAEFRRRDVNGDGVISPDEF